jgi:hypothetical protein
LYPKEDDLGMSISSVVEVFTCVGGKGRNRGQLGLSKGLKMEQCTLSMGLARTEVYSNKQIATILSKGLFLTLNIQKHHTWGCILYAILFLEQISTFSPLQVKNKPCDEESEHAFILANNANF